MFRLDADRPVEFCDGLRRRDFLHAGSLTALGLGLTQFFGLKAQNLVDKDKSEKNCIMLMLVGGPSQLDTWDMKPKAPIEIRGAYQPIKTNVTDIEISENFPRMAKPADKYALIRTMYHTAAAVHDTGHQMMQTGRLFQGGVEHPHIGCVLGKLKGPKGDVPPHVLLPRPIGNTGGNMPHGQNAGFLGKTFDPFVLNADPSDPNFKVPDMLPPDYLSALRVDRRRTWRKHVRNSEVRIGRIGVEDEWVVGFAQETGVLTMRHVAARVADGPRQQHVRRDIALGPLELRDHAAEVRIFDAAEEQMPRLHHLMAGIVNGGGGVVHAADQRVLVRVLGHARKVFRDFDARNVGLDGLVGPPYLYGSIGFHVPGIELGRSAHQHQHDAIGVALFLVHRALRLQREEPGQTEAERGKRASVEKIAAAQTVAEFHTAVGIESKHGPSRRRLLALILTPRTGVRCTTCPI